MTFEEYTNSSAFANETRDTGKRQKRNRRISLVISVIKFVLCLSFFIFELLPEEWLPVDSAIEDVLLFSLVLAALLLGVPFQLYVRYNTLPAVTENFFAAKLIFIREAMRGRWDEFVHRNVLEVRVSVQTVNNEYVNKLSLLSMHGEILLDIASWKGRGGTAEFIDAVLIGMLEYATDRYGSADALRYVNLQIYLNGVPMQKKPSPYGGIFFMSKGKWSIKGKNAIRRLQKYKIKYNL